MTEGDEYWLTISRTMARDAGEYQCKAINKAGEAFCSANLYITEDKMYIFHNIVQYSEKAIAKKKF